jgi:hypothetical protein
VQISVGGGRSRQEIQGILEEVKKLSQGLTDLQRTAEASAQAVNRVSQAHAATGRQTGSTVQQRAIREQTEMQRMARQEERQAAQMAAADTRLRHQEETRSYVQMRAQQRAADRELNAGLTKLREQETAHHRSVMEAKTAREASTAGRIAGAVGWAPGVPQEVYMAQMALESLLPAIGGGTLLMLMGGIGAAMGGLAVAGFASGQTQSGAAINAVAGLPTSGTGGEFTSAAAMTTAQLRANVGDDKTAMAITSGLAQGGLPESQSLGPAFDLAATAVHVFGVSAQEAAFFVSNSMVMLGKSVQDTAMLMEGIAATAVDTGQSPANLMRLAGAPDLGATIKGDTSTLSAAMLQVGGSEQGAQWLQSVALAHGLPAIALASAAGIPANQLDSLRSTPAGAAQVTQAEVNATLGRYMTGPNDEMGYTQAVAAFQAMGVTPPSFTEAQRILSAGPNALPAAQTAAVNAQAAAQARLSSQSARQNAIAMLAAGDVAGANNAASPLTPQEQAGLHARLAFDNAAAGDTNGNRETPGAGTLGGGTLHGMTYDAANPGVNVQGAPSGGPTGPAGAASMAAAAATQPNGQVAPNAIQIVQGAAEVVIRLVSDATGRTVAVKNISIPLSNGQQSADQYLSRSGETRPN